jgi:uncharacterized protein YdhG (YjbR/CyaY superfamily)
MKSNVDLYIEAIESDQARGALIRLRDIIRDEVPEATEVISYGMPMYMFHGMVAGIAAYKRHCSFYPGHTVADFAEELTQFKISKGTVQFQPEMPLPEDLVRRMVRARANENFQVATERKKSL